MGSSRRQDAYSNIEEGGRVLTSGSKGAPIMDVDRINNVLVVKVLGHRAKVMGMSKEIMVAAINSPEYEFDSYVQRGTLMHFHHRLGHISFDTIIKMAKNPASCIKLTDTRRMNFLACAQDKQTKQAQSKVDTGMNSPIDFIGGMICSDLKGPIIPRDRLGNRYLVNFIDHRSNFCRVFLTRLWTLLHSISSTSSCKLNASSASEFMCYALMEAGLQDFGRVLQGNGSLASQRSQEPCKQRQG
ncbi:unnamed protein product [Peronospora effusa]|nr:unnamed protein product [Peronospora effusa]